MVTKTTTLFRLYASNSYNKMYQRNIFIRNNEIFFFLHLKCTDAVSCFPLQVMSKIRVAAERGL